MTNQTITPITSLYSEYLQNTIDLRFGEEINYIYDHKPPKKIFISLDRSVHYHLKKNAYQLSDTVILNVKSTAKNFFQLSLAALECNASFLALELIPYLKEQLSEEIDNQTKLVLVAQQFKGVVASYAAARYPQIFSGSIVIGGS